MSSVTFSTTVGGDGSTVTDDDDATTGLRNGGWRTRFVPALAQEVAVAANAVASATAALSSKNAAAASASTATTQASNASTSATNASNSATAAAASYDSFDDRYLGVKTSDPSVDNDGNALLVGALYWNSATSVFKVWSGSAWITNLTSNQFAANVATFLATPSSANLAAALTDKTGTGANVFATNPTFPAQINLTANSGYNIYASGSADNYLAGSLGIGSPVLTGYNLRVDKQITGSANPINCYLVGEVQADATGDAHNIYSSPSVANSTFTLPALYHFRCVQGTFGASAAVTNQFGFNATSNLTDATNNYGFYGGINASAGTTRYNLYMAGTADNYLAGNLGVGNVPVSSITAVGTGQSTASFNTSTGLGGALIVGDTGGSAGNGGAIVFSASYTAWRFAAIKGMAVNGASNSQGDLVFSVRPAATDLTLTESFRLLASKDATFAGSVGIGATANASAILDAQSTTKGVRFPNMTTTQKLAIATPAAGLVVFDTTLSKLCVYSGAAWQTITSA